MMNCRIGADRWVAPLPARVSPRISPSIGMKSIPSPRRVWASLPRPPAVIANVHGDERLFRLSVSWMHWKADRCRDIQMVGTEWIMEWVGTAITMVIMVTVTMVIITIQQDQEDQEASAETLHLDQQDRIGPNNKHHPNNNNESNEGKLHKSTWACFKTPNDSPQLDSWSLHAYYRFTFAARTWNK